MNTTPLTAIDDEIERYDVLIKAAERWGDSYAEDPTSHATLIKTEARLQRLLRTYFRGFADNLDRYVSWYAYNGQVRASQINAAVDINVIVSDQLFDDIDGQLITVVFDTVATAITTGAQAGEMIYKIPLGIQSTDAIIQDLTTRQIANLVGKRVEKDGTIVDNPKATYRISDKTRNDITKSIQTSIALGEDRESAAKRLKSVINNPKRAETIAQTETVNAYAKGLMHFAVQSNATGKEWQDVGAIDICHENAKQGIVPLNHVYENGVTEPAAHTGCRCGLRLVYANEFTPSPVE